MKKLMLAAVILGWMPIWGHAEISETFGSFNMEPGWVNKERAELEQEASARKEEQEAGNIGVRFDWARDAVLIEGTDTKPLEDWKSCENMEENKGKAGFCMGANDSHRDEQPIHKSTIRSFWMAKTDVTVAQYRACVRSVACARPERTSDLCNWTDEPGDYENHPMNCVTWGEAREFAAFVGGRLPTEAEWEFAARSRGKNQRYPWGMEEPTCDRAVMSGNGGLGCGSGRTLPVCSKAEVTMASGRKVSGNTEQGLCDMAGEVRQWIEDAWYDSYVGAPSDGSARRGGPIGSGVVIRGSSFRFKIPGCMRNDYRSNFAAQWSVEYVGFRPVAAVLP